tara:strand:- start:276 stop:1130 length:855 start_codon:yes stop_codon:yes gene_type:complete
LRISKNKLNDIRQRLNYSGDAAKSKGFNGAVLYYFEHYLKKKYNLKKMRDLVGCNIKKEEYDVMALMNKAQDKAKITKSGSISAILHRNEENETTKQIVIGMLQGLDCDCNYNDWRNIIFMLLNTGWDCAYELARNWSAKSENFDQKSFDRLVQSFDPHKCVHLHIKQLEQFWNGVKKEQNEEDLLTDLTSDAFYKSREWLYLRSHVLDRYGSECMQCGRSKKIHNVVIHVDHIIPRSIAPHLHLDRDNLQILCGDCNVGKSNRYAVDYRPDNSRDLNESNNRS